MEMGLDLHSTRKWTLEASPRSGTVWQSYAERRVQAVALECATSLQKLAHLRPPERGLAIDRGHTETEAERSTCDYTGAQGSACARVEAASAIHPRPVAGHGGQRLDASAELLAALLEPVFEVIGGPVDIDLSIRRNARC